MSRDANQIAQEYSRQHLTVPTHGYAFEPPGGGPATNTANQPKPNRGTFNVWADGFVSIADSPTQQFEDVTVLMGTPGVVILGSEEGSTYLLYPQPGWYCEFIPNDEGE